MRKASWTAAAAIAIWASTAAIAIWTAFPATARGAPGEWTWPVRGPVITRYANDDARPYAGGMHRGIDIAAAVGTKVAAARGGEVTYAGALGSAGLTVAIVTADGRYATSYLHLSRIDTERGATVAAGERLGAVGASGRRSAEQPHLHFGVRIAGSDHDYVDPLTLLPSLPGASAPASAPVPVSAPAPLRAAEAPVPARAPAPAAAHARTRAPHAVPAGPRSLRERVPARALPPLVARERSPAADGAGWYWGRLLLIAGVALLGAAAAGRPLLRLLARLAARFERLRAKRLGDRSQEAPHARPGSSDAPAGELVPQLN